MYSTPLCQMCFWNKGKNIDSTVNIDQKKSDEHCHTKTSTNAAKQTCPQVLCFVLLFRVWQQNRFHISFIVQHWHVGPGYAVQRWLYFPCSAHLKPLLYLQLCSSVDVTISNSLSYALFERACKLECWM